MKGNLGNLGNTQVTNNNGIGLTGLLCVLFVGLKLTGFITWSWWWVLSPLWIPLAILGALCLFCLFIFLLGTSLGWWKK